MASFIGVERVGSNAGETVSSIGAVVALVDAYHTYIVATVIRIGTSRNA